MYCDKHILAPSQNVSVCYEARNSTDDTQSCIWLTWVQKSINTCFHPASTHHIEEENIWSTARTAALIKHKLGRSLQVPLPLIFLLHVSALTGTIEKILKVPNMNVNRSYQLYVYTSTVRCIPVTRLLVIQLIVVTPNYRTSGNALNLICIQVRWKSSNI